MGATLNLIIAMAIIGILWFLLDKALRADHRRVEQYLTDPRFANGRATKWSTGRPSNLQRTEINFENPARNIEAALSQLDATSTQFLKHG